MCLGIPGKVVSIGEIDGGMPWGKVEFDGVRRRVCLACVPNALIGDYVIVHAGMAIGQVDEDEALRVFELVNALQQTDGWGDSSDVKP